MVESALSRAQTRLSPLPALALRAPKLDAQGSEDDLGLQPHSQPLQLQPHSPRWLLQPPVQPASCSHPLQQMRRLL